MAKERLKFHMGLFNFKKKNFLGTKGSKTQSTDFEHLTKEGELPFGWVHRNKVFVEKINNEHSYFLNQWLNSRTGSPQNQYATLKSFIMHLEDVEKLCKSKGECFEFWFYNILTSPDYIQKRKNELENLATNMVSLQEEYVLNSRKEEEKQRKIITMKSDVITLLKENDGILQSDFWKLFDDEICRSAASDIVYALVKEGKIERTKSGRSFILKYKESEE